MRKLQRPSTEDFLVLPGVLLTATYSPTGKLCSLETPPGVAATKHQVDEALRKALPSSFCVSQRSKVIEMDGLSGIENIYYNKVIISEDVFAPGALNKHPGAVVTFK